MSWHRIKKQSKPKIYGFKTTIKRGKDLTENTYSAQAYALTVAKLKAAGKPIPSGSELSEAVRKEGVRRIAAINFLVSGWLYGVKVFARAIGKNTSASTSKNASRITRKNGFAEKARPGNNSFTTFQNTSASKLSSNPNPGMKIAEDGLALAAVQTISRMREYIAKKQQQRTDKILKRAFR